MDNKNRNEQLGKMVGDFVDANKNLLYDRVLVLVSMVHEKHDMFIIDTYLS